MTRSAAAPGAVIHSAFTPPASTFSLFAPTVGLTSENRSSQPLRISCSVVCGPQAPNVRTTSAMILSSWALDIGSSLPVESHRGCSQTPRRCIGSDLDRGDDMHVGYGCYFQNPDGALSDAEVYRQELRLAEMAEPLGFDSIWSVEHHFDDYTMCPDVLQLLTYFAGRTRRIKLGSMVVVLPWHDPIRVAEQISLLDHVSDGRLILGLGRGLARIEYEGFRLDQNEGRNLFVEYAELVLNALENGYMEGGKFTRQPRREIRPRPARSFKGRTYAAAVSPESMPIMAKLGVGLLVIPQKPWDVVKQDFEVYHKVWREVNGSQPPPKPLCGGFFYVDEDKARAEERATHWISAYYHTVMKHYEMTSPEFGQQKSYEFYSNVGKFIRKHGA